MADYGRAWLDDSDDDDAIAPGVNGMTLDELQEVVLLQHSKLKDLAAAVLDEEGRADRAEERTLLLEADVVKLQMQAKLLRGNLAEASESRDRFKQA